MAAPAADAKIGTKIEYLMKAHLGPALRVHGFERKGRTVWREAGEGEARVLQVVNLQGNKWNEGSTGSVCMNLGVQFVEQARRYAAEPGQEWFAPYVGKPDEAACQVRERIDAVLPEAREAWWPDGLVRGRDHWFEIKAKTDLDALGDTLARLAVLYALPWLERAAVKAG